ncbi:MAG: hypothetical protein K1Y36_07765 [Blastocatellia bacterium]|nr:hypothetical protein [Blastocatellia bacterium]
MPASTDMVYLNALLQAIRQPTVEDAFRMLTAQFPGLDATQMLRDINWAKQLKQRGYSKQEILEDMELV